MTARLGPAPLPVLCCDGCSALAFGEFPFESTAVCTARVVPTTIRHVRKDTPTVAPNWCPHKEAGRA